MNFIRERVLKGEFMAGAWCNLGSNITVEMASVMGFDWVLVDQEHGPGDNMNLLSQVQAISAGGAAPLVRIAWNEMPRFKRALDIGAAGIMVPYVQSRSEAQLAAASMRYPPAGIRGVASTPRAAGYGSEFEKYQAKANDNLLTIVQIETSQTIKNLDEIAIVPGVDVLFVGPLDLSISLNLPGRFQDPRFIQVLKTVAQTAKKAGRAAGILVPDPGLIDIVHGLGFTFVAAGSDGGMVMTGLKKTLAVLQHYK
jgi:2-keto-3-deoxy-L-rhamnonate aldolase RhmA